MRVPYPLLMTDQSNRRFSGNDDDSPDWDTPEDAVMVIRAWHESGTEDRATWHWRGQISHGNTTKRFVGVDMLCSVIDDMLGAVTSAKQSEDRNG